MDAMTLPDAFPLLVVVFAGLTVTIAVGELKGESWPFSRAAWLCGMAAMNVVSAIAGLSR